MRGHDHQRGMGMNLRIRGRRAGFTLVELLTVILIIAIIVAIVVPALGSVRRAARKTETSAQITGLTQAIAQFTIDQRRAPGYFSAQQMGSQANETRGFSGMQNIMLDLAGGVVSGTPTGSPSDPPTDPLEVGPNANPADNVLVIRGNIGLEIAGNKLYYRPTTKAWRVIERDTAAPSEFGYRVSEAHNAAMPELIDAFGNPLLAWVEDEGARAIIEPNSDVRLFASRNTNVAGANVRSKFYWAQNAAFLQQFGAGASLGVGRTRVDQTRDPERFSLIAPSANVTDDFLAQTMAGVFGNPNSPTPLDGTGGRDGVRPTSSRGKVIIHSAGQDNVYFGIDNQIGRTARLNLGNRIPYWLTFFEPVTTSVRRLDANGQPTSVDILDGFDDVVQAAQ